jgi:hypothetical protein
MGDTPYLVEVIDPSRSTEPEWITAKSEQEANGIAAIHITQMLGAMYGFTGDQPNETSWRQYLEMLRKLAAEDGITPLPNVSIRSPG